MKVKKRITKALLQSRNEQLEAKVLEMKNQMNEKNEEVIEMKNTVNKLLEVNLKLNNDLEDQKKINESIIKENKKLKNEMNIKTTNQSCELDTQLTELNNENQPPPLKKRKLTKPSVLDTTVLHMYDIQCLIFQYLSINELEHGVLLTCKVFENTIMKMFQKDIIQPRWMRKVKYVSQRYIPYRFMLTSISNLKWWIDNKSYKLTVKTSKYIAMSGNLEVLKWARSNGCPWDVITCSFAAKNGHLEVLKWARSNDCPWDEYTCRNAARNGHLEVLKWARSNGCPWNEDMCRYFATTYGHNKVVEYINTST